MLILGADTAWIVPLSVAAVLFIAGTPYVRRKRKQATVELEESTLAVAQREIQIERDARLAAEERCSHRIEEQDRRHARELADVRESFAARHGELQGQVSVLTDSFAATIAQAVLDRLDERGAFNGD